jgi:hypothetical protein
MAENSPHPDWRYNMKTWRYFNISQESTLEKNGYELDIDHIVERIAWTTVLISMTIYGIVVIVLWWLYALSKRTLSVLRSWEQQEGRGLSSVRRGHVKGDGLTYDGWRHTWSL